MVLFPVYISHFLRRGVTGIVGRIKKMFPLEPVNPIKTTTPTSLPDNRRTPTDGYRRLSLTLAPSVRASTWYFRLEITNSF